MDGDLLIKICSELGIEISDLTRKTDASLYQNVMELLDDNLFEELDILGPEVKELVNSNPKVARALIKLGDNYKKKDHDIVTTVENLSGKMIDSKKTSFPGEEISDYIQANSNYFPKLEEFANTIFSSVQTNNRTSYLSLCKYLENKHKIKVRDVIPDESTKPFSKIFDPDKKNIVAI